jgi:uncharacterized protein YdcH (DUF465 family)
MDFHHPLLLEFAEYRDLILKLKDEREDFRGMVDEYHAIDRRICRIERELETATDQETETLKKRRLWLKDRLYHELLTATSQAA